MNVALTLPPRAAGFPIHHGRMADAVRAADWASSPLGPIHAWPPSLKTALGIVLGAAGAKILLWGPSQITFYNDACARLLGPQPDVPIGTSYPLGGSGIWPTLKPFVEAAMAGDGQLLPHLEGVSYKNGREETGHFTICCSSVCDEDGAVLGTLTDIFETTSQVQVRQALEAEKRFRELFDRAPVFLALTSGADFRIDYANHAYRRLVGGRELVGKPAEEAVPELANRGFVHVLRQVYGTGRPRFGQDTMVELRMEPDGRLEQRFVDFIYQPVVNGGEVTGVLIVGNDVTVQHSANKRARELQDELQRAYRLTTMGTMATTLAHELNQPLVAIQAYAEGSRHLLAGGEDGSKVLDDALKSIAENARRGAEIIRRIKGMTEEREVRSEVFDLDEAVREAVELVTMGSCHGMRVSFDFASGAKVSADRIQVQQVLLNLIRNACEACEEGEHPEVTISTAPDPMGYVVSVRDLGKGLTPEALTSLFEPFKSTKADGMGVGLWISRKIVEALGGRIWAEKRPAGGTLFCFTLPKT